MIQRAAMDSTIRRSLGMIVALVHEMGGLVLAEGIETDQQAVMAINADVDLVQGFLFSESFNPASGQPDCSELFERIHDLMIQQNIDEEGDFRRSVKSYVDAFNRSANMLEAGLNIYTATQEMAQMDRVLRFYLLDEFGTQIGENIISQHHNSRRDMRLAPLFDTQGANWAHRPYFRRAMAHPDQIQLTRPYLSLTDARMCLTLTRVVKLKRERAVLCCDLEWREDAEVKPSFEPDMLQNLFSSR
ncbi:MAG: EAL domain-containing protein [Gammaproteobacteria bacterium]|nr:EAL domain-containing protein [Gammaproteobacteria bacterium]